MARPENELFNQRIKELLENNTFDSDNQAAEFYIERYGYKSAKDTLRRRIAIYRQQNNISHFTRERVITDTKIEDNKKFGDVNWREVTEHLIERQNLHSKSSYSQDLAEIKFTTKLDKILLVNLADLHLGSIGADYKLFLEYTNFILNNDNVFLALYGDLIDNFVAFRNVLAMHQQILSPDQQDEFLESWIKDIKHKILFATWGNHEEFSERVSGRNIIKRILKHNLIYFNGIGTVNLSINDIDYKLAFTHKTRFNSSLNLTHGLKRLAQMDIPDADLYVAGDTHNPAFEIAYQRGNPQIYMKLGTLKINDGYSKRYFSYFTSSAMPCVVLSSRDKEIVPFWNVKQAMKYIN